MFFLLCVCVCVRANCKLQQCWFVSAVCGESGDPWPVCHRSVWVPPLQVDWRSGRQKVNLNFCLFTSGFGKAWQTGSIMYIYVSWFCLMMRHEAVKQKDLSSVCFSSLLFSRCGIPMKHCIPLPILMQNHSGGVRVGYISPLYPPLRGSRSILVPFWRQWPPPFEITDMVCLWMIVKTNVWDK